MIIEANLRHRPNIIVADCIRPNNHFKKNYTQVEDGDPKSSVFESILIQLHNVPKG